jgi:hypothetical protein
MKSEYKYVVEIDNENNDDWIRLYSGFDLQEAEKFFNDYKFVEGDNKLHLDRIEIMWRYEGQKVPDVNLPKTLMERYN